MTGGKKVASNRWAVYRGALPRGQLRWATFQDPSKYTARICRALRKVRGVGRPPRVLKLRTHDFSAKEA